MIKVLKQYHRTIQIDVLFVSRIVYLISETSRFLFNHKLHVEIGNIFRIFKFYIYNSNNLVFHYFRVLTNGSSTGRAKGLQEIVCRLGTEQMSSNVE